MIFAESKKTGRTARKYVAVLLLVFGLAGPSEAERQTVRVGIYQNRPKVFQDERGVPQGIFIDLLQAAAAEENWKLEFVPGTWTEGLNRLTRGEIDLMPDVSFSPEREKQWAFNLEPALSDWFQVVCPKIRPVGSILDLAGKKIAVLQNSVQETTLSAMVRDFDLRADLVQMPDYDTGLQMIRTGQTDLLIANRYLAANLHAQTGLEASPVIFNPTRLHFAAPLTGRRPLLDALDRNLIRWKSDPESVYYRSLKHWTGEAPKTVVPRYVKYAAIFTAGLVVLITAVALLLRWQVRVRTAELRQKTGDLESALHSLKETQEKAIQQERLHTLGQMAGGIAHDFNNILTPVIGLADLLLLKPEKLNDQPLVKKFLENISKAGRDGAEIVKRMKEFYRAHEPEECFPVDPCDVIESVIELSRPRWSHVGPDGRLHIEIKCNLNRGLYILVRESELREALMNLLFNALDALPGGGAVTFSVQQDAQGIAVRVKDNGIGMTDEVRRNCLAAFYTTKGREGTGMGLAMIKSMCDRYGALLQIESEEGRGTTVSLFFAQHQGVPSPYPSTAAHKKIRPLNILAVDDEPRSLYVLDTVLTADGHHVTTVEDPGTALKLACSNSYDLVITDRSMPGLSGEELARSIHALPAAPPVILLTGTPSANELTVPDDVQIMLKPLDISRLNQLLADMGFCAPA